METLAALAAQVQNLATRLHELEEKLNRVSVESKELQWFRDSMPKKNRAELLRLRARLHGVVDPVPPVCQKCGNNRQVWVNQITGVMTCHRISCEAPVDLQPKIVT